MGSKGLVNGQGSRVGSRGRGRGGACRRGKGEADLERSFRMGLALEIACEREGQVSRVHHDSARMGGGRGKWTREARHSFVHLPPPWVTRDTKAHAIFVKSRPKMKKGRGSPKFGGSGQKIQKSR